MATKHTTVLELDEHCLQNVLDYLDEFDLSNLAEAFDISAQNIVKLEQNEDESEDMIQSKYVRFAKAVRNTFLHIIEREYFQCFSIWNDKKCVQLLRRFGDLLPELQISFRLKFTEEDSIEEIGNMDETEAIDDIEKAIVTYCYDTLHSVQLNFMNKNSFSTISKPFVNVERLHIAGSVSNNLFPLNKWFPKLRVLILDRISEPEYFEYHFPYLEKLFLYNEKDQHRRRVKYDPKFSNSNLAILLHLNPQLKSLHVWGDRDLGRGFGIQFNEQFMHMMSQKCPILTDLSLNMVESQIDDLPFDNFIEMNSITSLKVDCIGWFQLRYNAPIRSTRLKELCIHSAWWNSLDEDFRHLTEFAKNNNNIRKLTLHCIYHSEHMKCGEYNHDLHGELLANLMNALPKLKTICIPYNWQVDSAAEGIVRILCNHKHLTTFCACKQPIVGTNRNDNDDNDDDEDDDDDDDEYNDDDSDGASEVGNDNQAGDDHFDRKTDAQSKKQKFTSHLHRCADKYGFDVNVWNMEFEFFCQEMVIFQKITQQM